MDITIKQVAIALEDLTISDVDAFLILEKNNAVVISLQSATKM